MTVKPPLPVLRPALPTAVALAPYLQRIDATRWYSNFGPLLHDFEVRLAELCGLPHGAVATFSNGTLALMAALHAEKMRLPEQARWDHPKAVRRRCLMPSWTFVATAHAAVQVGLHPYFVDVDAANWALSPTALRARTDLEDVAAVIVVAPFGAPVDQAAWDAFAADTGIIVLIDAAAGFDALTSVPSARPGRCLTMVSLHATKAVGIGEGGLLVSSDADLVQEARRWGNFGFDADSKAEFPATNAKISEYSAAIGLAALDLWPERRPILAELSAAYRAALSPISGLKTVPGFGQGWVSSTCNIITPLPTQDLAAGLAARGIQTRRWWNGGCKPHPAFAATPSDPLPVTDRISAAALGIPFFHDLPADAVPQVAEALADIIAGFQGAKA
jgi:dTDP-4-amino-4,6-dideoxygalactose transaminase